MFLKQLGTLLVIFILGIAGGVFGSQILWPLIIERPLFYQYRLNQAPTVINETKEVTIQENVALTDAIEKVRKAVVGIQSVSPAGKVTLGSGVVLTSDGRAVTLSDLVPAGARLKIIVMGKEVQYQVLKRDTQLNLALIKIEGNGFSTVGFADGLRTGERVFLAANMISFAADGQLLEELIANEGIVRVFNTDEVQTNILEKKEIRGSSLFDIQGNLVGINDVDSTGRVVAIPVQKIREFAGL